MPIFVMRGLDGPEGLGRRPAVRPLHLEHLRELERQQQIRFAGPIFADDGTTPIGSVVVFESSDLAAARSHQNVRRYTPAPAGQARPPSGRLDQRPPGRCPGI